MKSPKIKQRDKLDKLWSQAVRKRDGICQRCRKTKASQAAHIFGRSNMATRWDLMNGIGLCYFCHIIWAHRQPVEFTLWVQSRLKDDFKKLQTKAQGIKQWSLKEMETLERQLNG